MKDQIAEEIKEDRLDRVMLLQQEISLEQNEKRIGKKYRVLVEDYLEDEGIYLGRSYAESPEVDGQIIISSEGPLEIGSYVEVEIVDAEEYELYGEAIF